MPVSEAFKSTIDAYLQNRAQGDPLFAETLNKPNKNMDDCCIYIVNEVQKTKRQGFADEEIFSMAVHYYDEDDIQPGAPINARVVVNHQVEETKKKMAAAIENRKSEPEQKKAAKKPVSMDRDLINQMSLF